MARVDTATGDDMRLCRPAGRPAAAVQVRDLPEEVRRSVFEKIPLPMSTGTNPIYASRPSRGSQTTGGTVLLPVMNSVRVVRQPHAPPCRIRWLLRRSGAFKFRGALNAILSLSEAERGQVRSQTACIRLA